MRTSGSPSVPTAAAGVEAEADVAMAVVPFERPFFCVPFRLPWLLSPPEPEAAGRFPLGADEGPGGGILARRRTSAWSSGKVVQVPERRSSRARARTRSGQPVEAREVVSVVARVGIVLLGWKKVSGCGWQFYKSGLCRCVEISRSLEGGGGLGRATYLGSVWRWRRRARWVGRGRAAEDDCERSLGTGMGWVSGEIEDEAAGAIGGCL